MKQAYTQTLPKLKIVNREAFLVDAVKGRTIMSVGLGGFSDSRAYSFNYRTADLGRTISGRMAAAANSATFVDVSKDAIEAFSKLFPGAVHEVDITSEFASWPNSVKESRFDLVVIGEVLEHLANPGLALCNLRRLLSAQGCIIITVPSAFALGQLAKMFAGVECVHPEHTCYYSYLTVTRLISMCGLRTLDTHYYYSSRPHTASVLRRFARTLVKGLVYLFPQFSDGLVFTVTNSQVPGAAVDGQNNNRSDASQSAETTD